MAKKKSHAAPRRRRSSSAAPRRTKRRRSRGMSEGLAESFNITKKDSAINGAMKGAAGAGITYLATKNIEDPKRRTLTQGLITLALVMLKQPAMAAGAAGVTTISALEAMKQPTMAEDAQFFDPSSLADDEPAILDASGAPLLLSDGEGVYNLSEYLPSYVPTY